MFDDDVHYFSAGSREKDNDNYLTYCHSLPCCNHQVSRITLLDNMSNKIVHRRNARTLLI